MSEAREKVPEYVHKAQEKRFLAEAKKFTAEAAAFKLAVDDATLDLKAKQHVALRISAQDWRHNTYRLVGEINDASVKSCMDELSLWHRIDPEAHWDIVFNSPGGSVVPGLALYDFLTEMRNDHDITTTAQGYAASMGGILLQAGTTRCIGKESYILIHEISGQMFGSFGDLEDRMAWLAKVQSRILDIFTERSAGKKTKEEFENAWKRKDFWLDSVEALEWGVVDGIR